MLGRARIHSTRRASGRCGAWSASKEFQRQPEEVFRIGVGWGAARSANKPDSHRRKRPNTGTGSVPNEFDLKSLRPPASPRRPEGGFRASEGWHPGLQRLARPTSIDASARSRRMVCVPGARPHRAPHSRRKSCSCFDVVAQAASTTITRRVLIWEIARLAAPGRKDWGLRYNRNRNVVGGIHRDSIPARSTLCWPFT